MRQSFHVWVKDAKIANILPISDAAAAADVILLAITVTTAIEVCVLFLQLMPCDN